jgi:hypothetical protein
MRAVVLLLLAVAFPVWASDACLMWEWEDERYKHTLGGFNIYWGCTNTREYVQTINLPFPDQRSFILALPDNAKCYVAMRAYAEGLFSVYSNEVYRITSIDDPAVEHCPTLPGRVRNFQVEWK